MKSPFESIFGENLLSVLNRICSEDDERDPFPNGKEILMVEGVDYKIIEERDFLTKSGKRILNIRVEMLSESGEKNKYPIRGQVVVKEEPKVRIKNIIWTLEGKTFYGRDTGLDLDEATVSEILGDKK